MSITFSYVAWFICLFFIASYIRLYPKPIFSNTKVWGLISILMLILCSLSVILVRYLSLKLGINGTYYFISDSHKLLAVATAVSWFLFFKNIKIPHSKVINAFGGATFGVLLIHTNGDSMRRLLWNDLLHNVETFDKGNLIFIHSFISIFGIFIVCALIDICRQKFIEKPFLSMWNKLFGKFAEFYRKKEEKLLNK